MARVGIQRVGALRQAVSFERRTQSAGDGLGNYQTVWAPLIERRAARIAPRIGGEDVIAERLQGVQNFDIWVRSDVQTNQLSADDRATDLRDGREFAIKYVGNLDERGRFLLLQCQLGVAVG